MKRYKESYSVNICTHYNKNTDTCITGCKKAKVIKGNVCPWDYRSSNPKEELQNSCPCYGE